MSRKQAIGQQANNKVQTEKEVSGPIWGAKKKKEKEVD